MKQKLFFTFMLLSVLTAGLSRAHEHHHQGVEGMEGHWMAPQKAARRPNPVTANEASVKRGKALFEAHCIGCHGAGGEGDGPAGAGLNPQPANLKAMAAHHSDGDLAWKIATGRGPMPGWKATLKSKQIWDLVNYVRRLGDLSQ